MATWTEASDAYTLHLRAAGRSEGTIRIHTHYLRRIRATAPTPEDVTTDHLRRLLATRGWSPETRKSCRGVLRTFFAWAHAEGLVPTDPAARLETVTVPEALPHPVPEPVITDVLSRCRERERRMILLGAYAGLRAAEIARVHAEDWDPWARVLTVVGKGRKERRVPVVHEELRAVLDELARRGGWLFPGRVDGHLSPGTVSHILSGLIPGEWTAHSLRHRFATRAHAGTHDLLAVSRLLGHARPETTRRYVQLEDDALIAAVRAASQEGNPS